MAPSTRSTRATRSTQPAPPQTPAVATTTTSTKRRRKADDAPPPSAPTTRRRLRSAKPDEASPLRTGVPASTRKKAVPKSRASKATKQAAEQAVEQDDASSVVSADTGYADTESDPGANIYFKKNRKLQQDLIESRKNPLIREYRPEGVLEGSASAFKLLEDVEKHAKTTFLKNNHTTASKPSQDNEVKTQGDKQEQPSPSVSATPQSQGFFGRVKDFLSSPFRASRSPSQTSSLTDTLTPTPTPVGESHSRHKKRKKISNRSRIIQKVVDSVPEDEKVKAKKWAESLLQKVAEDGSLKRKRQEIELGVTVGNLEHLQGTKPWKQGTFGLDDDIADLEDDDHAPAWAVLYNQMQIDEAEQQPPAKKRKSIHKATVEDDATSLSGSVSNRTPSVRRAPGYFPSSSPSGSSPLFNSGGKTASRNDINPRRAIEPSPLFDADANYRTGTNVFNELQGNADAPQTSVQKRAVIQESPSQQVPSEEADFSKGFCVPEGSSDEEEDDDDENDASNAPSAASTLWTQEPPPAPVPSHASLPAPLSENQASPAVAAEIDPVEHQRAKAMKHTPGKPSRLREVSVPSPSVKSDAGSPAPTSIPAPAFIPAPASVAAPTQVDGFDWGTVKEVSYDFPPDIDAHATDYVQFAGLESSWDDPIVSYDEDEMSF